MPTLKSVLASLGAVVSLLNPIPSLSPVPETLNAPHPQAQEITTTVPVDLLRAGFCETRLRHNDSEGAVIRGYINPQDVGIFQINEHYHLSEATRIGLNLESKQENIAYALRLYSQRGVKDWAWSYNPQTDQCKNQIILPPRESPEWKAILAERGFIPG